MRGVLVCAALVGCGGHGSDAPSGAPSRVIANAAPSPVAARLAAAHALVLGSSGTRDYRQAAMIYDALCADGCGEIEACRELVDLSFHEWGTVMTPARLAIPARLCDRGDQVACWLAALTGVRPQAAFTDDLTTLCHAGDAKACLADMQFDIGDVGNVLARPRPLAACNAGVASGCGSLFAGLWPYCSAHQTAPGTPCIDERAAEWKATGGDPSPLVTAWHQTQSLCARGDAEACEWVPGKQIDERLLCDAGNYHACESLVRGGDEHARDVACNGGLTELCTPARPRPSLGVTESWELRDRCQKGEQPACEAQAKRQRAFSSCAAHAP